MFVRINNNLVQILNYNCSYDAKGDTVFYYNKKFFVKKDGLVEEYHDPVLGSVKFNGRNYIKTEATSFIRDGVDYSVILPSESVMISRPALGTDKQFKRVDLANIGRFLPQYCNLQTPLGEPERCVHSRDLQDRHLLTRENGEVFCIEGDQIKPYSLDDRQANGRYLRLDLHIEPGNGQAPFLRSLFFRLRDTAGSEAWWRHFVATAAVAQAIAPCATPIIRNQNAVLFSGEADLHRCVNALQRTVAAVNATGFRSGTGHFAELLPKPEVTTVDNALLNALHHEFEAFGDRFKAGEAQSVSSNAYGVFCQLNDEIHACEGALANRHRTQEEAWWSLHASFMPDFYAPLPDEIYREFTMDWSFGTLFMGYHTLGKDILAAFWNEDLELFQRDEIRPQRISSCEFFAFFGPDSPAPNADMQAWWQANNLDQYGYRWGDPSNALGYIPVADLLRAGLAEPEVKARIKGCTHAVAAAIHHE